MKCNTSNNFQKFLPDRTNWFGWSSLFLTILIAFIWQANTPMFCDDFIFCHEIGDAGFTAENFVIQDSYITTLEQAVKSASNHYIYGNGRLSNIAFIFMQLLPTWFIKCFCGGMMAALACLLWIFCGKSSLENKYLSILIPLLYWIGFDWSDNMQSSDFQFNYTIGAVLMLFCLIRFFFREKRPGILTWIILVLLAFWHECFSIALGCFLGVQFIFSKDKKYLIAVIILFLGALMQYSPGAQYRISNSTLSYFFSNFFNINWSQLISKLWLVAIAFVLWFMRRKKISQSQRKEIDRFGYCYIAAVVAGLIILMYLRAPSRAFWPQNLLSICFILLITRTFNHGKIKTAVGVFLLSLYALWGANLLYYELRIKALTNVCIESLRRGNTVINDPENIIGDRIPFWLMNIPQHSFNADLLGYWAMPHNISDHNDGYIVIPPYHIDKDFDELPSLDRNNEIKLVNGNVMLRRKDGRKIKNIRATYGEPTISTSPLDIFLSYIKNGQIDSVIQDNYEPEQFGFKIGDSLYETIIPSPRPRTVTGRNIKKIEVEYINEN